MSASAASEPLVSDGEVESALAQAAAAGEQIPSFDDAVVAVPVDLPPIRRAGARAPTLMDDPPPDSEAVTAPAARPGFDPSSAPPLRTVANVLYLVLDRVLWLIDLPFRRLARDPKMIVFAAGVASLVISLAAVFAFPLIFPVSDPAKLLRDKVVAAEKARQAAPVAESGGGEPGAPAGNASSGHGAAPTHGDAPKPSAPAGNGGH